MAQRRFGHSQRSARAREPAAINDLHKQKEVIQIQHRQPRRPTGRTLSSIFDDFLAGSPVLSLFRAAAVSRPDASQWTVRNGRETEMERRQFLQMTMLGAATMRPVPSLAASETQLI